ncbi:MAG: polysaccharide pyruvyl transferase family protein [Patescibacteria group bacterium]
MKHSVQSPKNIIISHVYSSDNKGDAALTSVLIQDLRRTFPDAAITIQKFESVKKHGRFEGVPELPSFRYYALNKYSHPLPKLIYTLYMMSATLAWAAWYRYTRQHIYLPQHLREIAKIYAQADLIVPVGGGYIRSRKGLLYRFNIPLMLHPLLIGSLLRKPTMLYAQSVGPFMHASERLFVAFVLKRMTLVLLREDISIRLLASLGVTHNVLRAVDSGFLLQSKDKVDIHKKYHIPKGKLIVGVTVRSWLAGDAQMVYERAVAGALDDIVEHFGAHILFIPQVTATKGDDDRVASHRVHSYMHYASAATTITSKPDHYQIKAIYDGLDALVGTRFHSVIFSLTSYVPVLAIEYEHKTSGIMHDLGLDKWVIKI